MRKDVRSQLAEFASNLSDSDLKYLGSRLVERCCGDLGDALRFMSNSSFMDGLLSQSTTADEVYGHCDWVKEALVKEGKRRGLKLTMYPDKPER